MPSSSSGSKTLVLDGTSVGGCSELVKLVEFVIVIPNIGVFRLMAKAVNMLLSELKNKSSNGCESAYL